MGLALLVSSLLYFVAMQMEGSRGCLGNERMGLLEIKAYFVAYGGWAESELASWVDDRTSNCCNWNRVKCANISSGHVKQLSLYGLDSYYDNPNRRFNVSLLLPFIELVNLNLGDNSYEGWTDNEGFPILKKLETLDLSGNYLNSSILPGLNRLESLRSLNLGGNEFGCSFPAKGFPILKKLETLDLSGNYLNNSILPGLNRLESLRSLKLGSNGFGGSFTAEGFPILKKLETLDLSGNNLNSSILPDLQYLEKLKFLDLSENQLMGSIQDLQYLKKLKFLDISSNQLKGSIQDLQYLEKLKFLDLSGNQLKGSIQDLQYLEKLKFLDLSGNQLKGSIQGLCKMKALIELDLSDNKFSGQLPQCLSNLTNLRFLDLYNNLFSGSFPSFARNLSSLAYLSLSSRGSLSLSTLANHSNLEVLYLSSQDPNAHVETEDIKWFPTFQLKVLILTSCNLNKDKGGVIPSFLLYQYDLKYIDLSHNKLVGAFPIWLIQNNSRLRSLYMRNNSFEGNLQLSSIASRIDGIDISNNNISGLLSEDIGILLPNIFYLNFSMNNFEGHIPASIGKIKLLWILDLSHNCFSGKLPDQLAISNKYFVKLSNNFLHGSIPKISNWTSLVVLYLNNNNFNGTLEEVLSNNTRLQILDISNNSFSGAIPSSIGKLSSIRILLMAENQLQGEIPFEFSNMTQLALLDLSQNRLSGLIPPFNLSSLRFLYLQKNSLSGPIPLTLCQSSQLIALDLSGNNLSGTIPFWMDKLSELRVLLLAGNNFHGHLPIQLCNLRNVTIMDLSCNTINGSIPSCFKYLSFGRVEKGDHGHDFNIIGNENTFVSYVGFSAIIDANFDLNLPTMVPLSDMLLMTVEFRTKSNYYSYIGDILENMNGLDLSCNELNGSIPSQIGNLQQIRALNLSHNHLSGSIPITFSNLTQIESLDLSYNNLSGVIPSQLTQLNFLSNFNVSFNNLFGTPPSTVQFANFDEENYKGNPGLCGPLLKQKCEDDDLVPLPPAQSKGKETIVDMVSFYWCFFGAYITILLALVLVLYINPQWRAVWFYFIDKVLLKYFSL